MIHVKIILLLNPFKVSIFLWFFPSIHPIIIHNLFRRANGSLNIYIFEIESVDYNEVKHSHLWEVSLWHNFIISASKICHHSKILRGGLFTQIKGKKVPWQGNYHKFYLLCAIFTSIKPALVVLWAVVVMMQTIYYFHNVD